MLITDPWFYAAAIPAVLLFGIAKGGFGGGLGAAAVPLMLLSLGIRLRSVRLRRPGLALLAVALRMGPGLGAALVWVALTGFGLGPPLGLFERNGSPLLEPEQTVEKIDAVVLAGGSAFGLDAATGSASSARIQ